MYAQKAYESNSFVLFTYVRASVCTYAYKYTYNLVLTRETGNQSGTIITRAQLCFLDFFSIFYTLKFYRGYEHTRTLKNFIHVQSRIPMYFNI